MRIQVKSAPSNMSVETGRKMIGVIFTDAFDRIYPGTFFVPVENVLKRMPMFENSAQFSPFMEGIYLPKHTCVVL
jgi:hypothetical protein